MCKKMSSCAECLRIRSEKNNLSSEEHACMRIIISWRSASKSNQPQPHATFHQPSVRRHCSFIVSHITPTHHSTSPKNTLSTHHSTSQTKLDLSAEELGEVRQKVLLEADKNHDGKIELGEFSKFSIVLVSTVFENFSDFINYFFSLLSNIILFLN